jgi:hypothetical protein
MSEYFEERHGLAGARRTVGGMGGHVGAPHMGVPRSKSDHFEERHGLAGARRTLGGMGGHLGAPHMEVA